MMSRADKIEIIILAVLAMLLLSWIQGKINLKRSRRERQLWMPLAALVYGVAVLLLIWSVRNTMEQMIAPVDHVLTRLVSILPEVSSGILILNIIVMLFFLPVKVILLPFLDHFWNSRDAIERYSGYVYQYDDQFQRWFLRNDRTSYRRLFRNLSYATAGASGFLLGLTCISGGNGGFWFFLLPAAALLVVNELSCYLDGETREDWEHHFSGELVDSRRVGHFFRVREVLEKTFPEAVLASHTGTEFQAHHGATELLEQFRSSSDPIEQSVAQYFGSTGEREEYDVDGIEACSNLLHGRSVVFFDPFYKDLGPYIIIPMISVLMRGQKCLVLCGSDAACGDVRQWLDQLIAGYTRVQTLWRAGMLAQTGDTFEIGILGSRQLYDTAVLAANASFFQETGFVLLLEPGDMITTGQTALSIIAKNCGSPIYCVVDRYSSGLVDTLSHVLRTKLTNVAARPLPRCIYTGMAWDADAEYRRQELFDRQTRFLGNGLEIGATAVRSQIPEVTWYADRKAPLTDIRWIAGQNYAPIARYMNLSVQQASLYDRIRFVPDLFSAPRSDEKFILVEDEYQNLFGMMRTFLDRGQKHSFVNVLSGNYLLRDYMQNNPEMFLSNPDLIPAIVPDYTKTLRNTLIQLLIRMRIAPVPETEVTYELQLAGMDPQEETTAALDKLLQRFTGTDISILESRTQIQGSGSTMEKRVGTWRITAENFRKYFARSLATAYYIVEDEQREEQYVNARMFGHVTQTILPGQLVTYDGRCYQVRSISAADHLVVLRRAADLYDGRHEYRQYRRYTLAKDANGAVVYNRTVMDIPVRIQERNFQVGTDGYLDLLDYGNLASARYIDLSADPQRAEFTREYRSKDVLQIGLPGLDQTAVLTMALLLQELFRTIFPDCWQYVAVTAKPAGIRQSGGADNNAGTALAGEETDLISRLVYFLDGEVEEGWLYILEDSDMDLGILDAIVRNMDQIFSILADYLEWHAAWTKEGPAAAPAMGKVTLSGEPPEEKVSLLQKILAFLRKLFGGKGRKANPEEAERQTQPKEQGRSEDKARAEDGDHTADQKGNEEKEQAENKAIEGEDDAEASEQEKPGCEMAAEQQGLKFTLTRMFKGKGGTRPKTRRDYLAFGYDSIDDALKLKEVRGFLESHGYKDSALSRARTRKPELPKEVEAVNHCDFCGKPLSGTFYEELRDGRIRCADCSASAIDNEDEFKELITRVLEMMEAVYGVTYHVPISVRMADANEVAKGVNEVFTPSTEMTARTLGYAMHTGDEYSIVMENGAPRLAAILTMSHELTHIWQYLNWNDAEIRKQYGSKDNRDLVYEGMACWASVQLMYQIGETTFAMEQEAVMRGRNDIYGKGFELYCQKYPLQKDMETLHYSPFKEKKPL